MGLRQVLNSCLFILVMDDMLYSDKILLIGETIKGIKLKQHKEIEIEGRLDMVAVPKTNNSDI